MIEYCCDNMIYDVPVQLILLLYLVVDYCFDNSRLMLVCKKCHNKNLVVHCLVAYVNRSSIILFRFAKNTNKM